MNLLLRRDWNFDLGGARGDKTRKLNRYSAFPPPPFSSLNGPSSYKHCLQFCYNCNATTERGLAVYDHHANRKTKNQPEFPLATCCIRTAGHRVTSVHLLVRRYLDEKERSLY